MIHNYILHSKGEDWFHFRTDPTSQFNSFSVTHCHDGTVFMSGDLGCLAWRREWFSDNPDYGFPSAETGIDYFAEKIVRSDAEQKIHEWTTDKARWDMRAAMFPDRCNTDLHVLVTMCEDMGYGDWDYDRMVNAFCDLDHDMDHSIDMDEICEFGIDYTSIFKLKFDVLKSVSDLILESLQEDD